MRTLSRLPHSAHVTRSLFASLVLAGIVDVGAHAESVRQAPPLSVEAAKERASRGPVVSEERSTTGDHGIEGIRGLEATFVVAAPPDVVLTTLWEVEKFPEMFPDIEEMHVRVREDTRIDVEFFVDAVVKKARYTLRRELHRDARAIRWREVGEGDVRTIRGSWEVRPTESPAHSLVIYASYVDVGVMVPTALVRDLALRKVDELVARVRKAVARALVEKAVREPATEPAHGARERALETVPVAPPVTLDAAPLRP